MSSVQNIQQTFVEDMKSEEKFDAEAAKEAKNKAYNTIVNQLTPELKDYVVENFGDLQDYIMNQIEAKVYELKNNK